MTHIYTFLFRNGWFSLGTLYHFWTTFQDQASLVYNGFTIGPFVPIHEKSITSIVILFIFAYWMTLLVYGSSYISVDTLEISTSSDITTVPTIRSPNHKISFPNDFNRGVRFSSNSDLNIIMWWMKCGNKKHFKIPISILL